MEINCAMQVCLLTCRRFSLKCSRHARYIFIGGSLAAAPPRCGYSMPSTPSPQQENAARLMRPGFSGRRAALMKVVWIYGHGGRARSSSGDPLARPSQQA